MFSSPYILKSFGFWFIILQNRTKHHAKGWLFFILDFSLERQKKKRPKEPQETLTRALNSAFFMELNMIRKFWYFVFHHSKIFRILYFIFFELNTP